jgi:NDP-sugar pyrophosphorylase family protein
MAMNVEILAAGFGTRLDKFGEQCPKGLIPYKDTTLLGRMLSELAGFNVALVTNNRFFPAYSDYLAQNFPELHVQVVNNGVDIPEKRFGALGDLKLTLDNLNWYDRDLLVLSSDTYFTFPISDLLAFYAAHPGFTTVLHEVDIEIIKNRLGCGVLDGDRVVEFAEKSENPPSNLAAVPIYIYPKEVLPKITDYIKTGEGIDSPGKIIPWLIKNNIPVYGFTYKGEYLDVGTLSDLDKLKTL